MNKKAKAFAVAACAAICAGSLAACSEGGVVVNIIKDEKPYEFVNESHPVAEMDAGMMIDGKLDEARWTAKDQRWLYGMDKPNDKQYAEIEFTSFYGELGIFFGMTVEEFGNRIWVNHTPSRDAGHVNSAVDMYLGPVGVDGAGSKTFEFSFVADGEFASRVNQNDLVEVLAPYDMLPIVATQPIGGEINTPECRGYTVEAFFPYTFLEFAGWELPEDKSEMTIGINPVHIFSYNLEGSNTKADRYWSNWAPAYGIEAGWLNPATYFYFGAHGLKSYDYKINYGGSGEGTVTEKNNMPYVLAQTGATFTVEAINGADVAKLTVNGVNYLDKLTYEGAVATFTVHDLKGDIVIDVEFD